MKYLVTGGAGFIGSHLVEKLVASGESVRVLDNFSTGKPENIKPFLNRIELIEGDIRNLETCQKACKGIDYVLHEAALGSVPRSVEDPLTTNEVNITGTLNMLLAARDADVTRFVYASSSSVYGDSPVLPKVETMPANPLSSYALSKYTGEVYTLLFHKLYDFETVALRYFNVFGSRQDPHSQYAAVIPRFISLLLQGKSPTIYGDGKQTRDFTYVHDVVHANLLACKAPIASCGLTYNIACRRQITINDLFVLIRQFIFSKQQISYSLGPLYDVARIGDIQDSLADISLAKSGFGFKPSVSLEEGLKQTVGFFFKG